MRRFILPDGFTLSDDALITVDGEPFHHMVHVLRMTTEDRLLLMDRGGLVADSLITGIDRTSVTLRIISPPRPTIPPLPVTLCQALPKGDKIDLVIQKGVEIGIGRFILFPSRRSIPRIPPEKRGAKIDRLVRIGIEAARQSGGIPPEILLVDGFHEMLERGVGELRLMAWEEEEGVRFRDMGGGDPPRSVVLLVGPEGGFTPEEVREATAQGFIPLSLGPRILRTETAGIVLASLVQFRWGDLG